MNHFMCSFILIYMSLKKSSIFSVEFYKKIKIIIMQSFRSYGFGQVKEKKPCKSMKDNEQETYILNQC